MNTYQLSENNITLSFTYNKKLIEEIKKIEGRSYIPISKSWSIPTTLQNNRQIVNIIEKYGFTEIGEREDFEVNVKVNDHHSKIEGLGLKYQPREYQNFAIDYMLTYKKVINGDDCGIGKTAEAVFSCEVENLFPVVVVTLSSVKFHWEKFWKETNPNRTVSVIEAGKKERNWDADVIILNYDLIGKFEAKTDAKGEEKKVVVPKYPELMKIGQKCLILDEFHLAKSSKSARGKMCKKLAKDTEYVFGLTGTAILNKPVELVHPLNILGKFNELFGGWRNYIYKYCDAKETPFGVDVKGASNTLELNAILQENCYFRREKREVLKDLPDIQTNILDITINNKREYKTAKNNLIEYIQENQGKIKADKAKMAEFLVMRNVLRQLSGKGKVKEIITWIDNFLESTNEKLIVFGLHKDVLKPLSTHYKAKCIDGSLNAVNKAKIVSDFQKNKSRLLFGNMQAMGTGTDGLQNCSSNMLIIELPDVPGTLDQVVGRLDRSGQKNFVNIYYAICKETIDADIWDMLEAKRKVTEAINKGKKVEVRDLNDVIMKNYKK